jgi:UDP-N-acetylmuramate dehydrogenase
MTVLENVSLKSYNTFGIEAKAKWFASFGNANELEELLHYKPQTSIHSLILGGGSNILLTKDFEGLVLRNEIRV